MIKIKNWEKFQHFKDRRPPWIKLHREILEQRDINVISDCSFRVLVNLWLLASEDDGKEGKLPTIEDIAFRLRMTDKKIKEALQELSPFLITDDNEMISGRYQVDVLETETEAYSEGEEELYVSRFDDFWKMFPKKRKGNKQKAEDAYEKAVKRDTQENIMLGLVSYNGSDEVAKGFAKGAAAWLNDDRWTNEYTPKGQANGNRANTAHENAYAGFMQADIK